MSKNPFEQINGTAYHASELIDLAKLFDGDIYAAILLSKIVSWYMTKKHNAYYKFINPPTERQREKDVHKLYREGDSWVEELNISYHTFKKALDKIGTRVKSKKEMCEPFFIMGVPTHDGDLPVGIIRTRLVRYWTNGNNVTYWEPNLDAIDRLLNAHPSVVMLFFDVSELENFKVAGWGELENFKVATLPNSKFSNSILQSINSSSIDNKNTVEPQAASTGAETDFSDESLNSPQPPVKEQSTPKESNPNSKTITPIQAVVDKVMDVCGDVDRNVDWGKVTKALKPYVTAGYTVDDVELGLMHFYLIDFRNKAYQKWRKSPRGKQPHLVKPSYKLIADQMKSARNADSDVKRELEAARSKYFKRTTDTAPKTWNDLTPLQKAAAVHHKQSGSAWARYTDEQIIDKIYGIENFIESGEYERALVNAPDYVKEW